MTRSDILHVLDGTEPRFGRSVAFAIYLLILFSAFAIALETMPNLQPGMRRVLKGFEVLVLGIFIIEYALRLICTPKPLKYAFSFWGIVDLLAIVPALLLLQPQWAAARTFRLIRLVRLLKLFRTSRALDRMLRAFHSVKGELLVLGVLAAMILYVAAVGIYIFEHPAQPDEFTSIPMALWWAVASLTTVGYGDLVPITVGGRIFTTLVLFVGLGVVAGPAAIITTALLDTEVGIAGSDPTEPPEQTDKTNTEDVT